MFITQNASKYNTSNLDEGIPKKYNHLRNKQFDDWEIPPWELFIFKYKLLGKGSFSNVYLAKWRETFVVAKVIKNNVDKNLILREIDIMSKLHHPNIVQFLGYIDEPFIIVMEYIPNNDLSFHIKSLKKREKISIMKDILQALSYIHNRLPYSLIHRDIKPTNILLTKSKVAKITDFGLSKFYNFFRIYSNPDLYNLYNENISSIYNSELTDYVGTQRYMAPEILKSKNNNTNKSSTFNNYDNKIDIYSCGILLYEMFENKKYTHNTKMKWFWCPKNIKNIILNNMLWDNPERRMDALCILRLLNKLY